MLRCEICSGYATAGLAHLHGLPNHLCADCTREILHRREESGPVNSFKRELSRMATRFISKRPHKQAA